MNAIIDIDLSQIKPYEKNPRKNDNAIDFKILRKVY